jgi:hypothetical protein
MTDRPIDSRHSGEISRGHNVHVHVHVNESERLPLGLRSVMEHARQLSHLPARESTERFGRERLMAAAAVSVRPGADPFRKQSVLSRLRALPGGSWGTASTWGAVGAVAAVAVLGYFVLGSYGTLPLSLPQMAATAASTPPAPAIDEPLTYTTTGSQPAASNYLVAPAHAPASLHFSDGSQVTASPATRVRVDSTQSRGARVLLEEGVARADITHRDNTHWVFVAGPFDVRITGTSFTLAWDAADQVLDLTLHDGSVEVESPLGASHLKVKTGERFHASVTDGTMQLLAAGQAVAPAPDQADVAESGDKAPTANVAPARRGRTTAQQHKADKRLSRSERRAAARARARVHGHEHERAAQDAEPESDAAEEPGKSTLQLATASYADLVRAGAFEQVVAEATKAGLAKTLEQNSAEDVRALADAARYLHRTELAVRSLTVLRARFPGSHHSAAAAFLLGRTYENAEQAAAARRFYELYERESPSGEFAAEALAGRMRTVAGLEGAGAGRALAEQYLERYPRGVHAKTAKQFLR